MNFYSKTGKRPMIYIYHTQEVTFVEIYSIHIKTSRLIFKNNMCLQHYFFEHIFNVAGNGSRY